MRSPIHTSKLKKYLSSPKTPHFCCFPEKSFRCLPFPVCMQKEYEVRFLKNLHALVYLAYSLWQGEVVTVKILQGQCYCTCYFSVKRLKSYLVPLQKILSCETCMGHKKQLVFNERYVVAKFGERYHLSSFQLF